MEENNGPEQPFNRLTPAEAERLSVLIEECGEIIQAVGKIQRHGYNSTDPTDPFQFTNRFYLERELGDVRAAITHLIEAGDVNKQTVIDFEISRPLRIKKYLHHQ